MNEKRWRDWTDEELANEAQTEFRGQAAIVEMMRCVRDFLAKQQRATNWLTVALVVFAVVQAILTAVQIVRIVHH